MEHAPSQVKAKARAMDAMSRFSINDLEDSARSFARERPLVAVLAALTAGYLVARLASRR